jgi:hypothetical protein
MTRWNMAATGHCEIRTDERAKHLVPGPFVCSDVSPQGFTGHSLDRWSALRSASFATVALIDSIKYYDVSP